MFWAWWHVPVTPALRRQRGKAGGSLNPSLSQVHQSKLGSPSVLGDTSATTDMTFIPHRLLSYNGCCPIPPSGGAYHGSPSVANEGRFGAQVFFLHDAGRGDGERDQVEGEDHGEESAKDGELGGCRDGQEGHPVSHSLRVSHWAQPCLVSQIGLRNWCSVGWPLL